MFALQKIYSYWIVAEYEYPDINHKLKTGVNKKNTQSNIERQKEIVFYSQIISLGCIIRDVTECSYLYRKHLFTQKLT